MSTTEELLKAFASPTWWILTVVVGLLLNVVAPFITRGVESFWQKYSQARQSEVARKSEAFTRRSAELASSPTGLIEAKLEVIYRGLRLLVVLCVLIFSIQFSFVVPDEIVRTVLAGAFAFGGYFATFAGWRAWNDAHKLHNAVTDRIRSNASAAK
jgi:hypothetical protein